MARSWTIAGAGLDLNVVRAVGVALITIVGGGLALAALSTVGILVPPGWWQTTVAVSAITSAVLLILFVEPQLLLGLGIDAVLLAMVATGRGCPDRRRRRLSNGRAAKTDSEQRGIQRPVPSKGGTVCRLDGIGDVDTFRGLRWNGIGW